MVARELTNRFAGEVYLLHNGLGKYSLVRDISGRVEYVSMTSENQAIHSLAVEDMRSRRAGGWFGSDDDGIWYPILRSLADQIAWPSPTPIGDLL